MHAPNTAGCSSCCRTKGSSDVTVFLSSKRCPPSWKVRIDCRHYILMIVLNKQPQTADKGSTSSFEIWRGLKNPHHKRTEYYETSYGDPNVGRCIGTTKVLENGLDIWRISFLRDMTLRQGKNGSRRFNAAKFPLPRGGKWRIGPTDAVSQRWDQITHKRSVKLQTKGIFRCNVAITLKLTRHLDLSMSGVPFCALYLVQLKEWGATLKILFGSRSGPAGDVLWIM